MNNNKKRFITSTIGAIVLAFCYMAQAENGLEGAWVFSSWENLGNESVAAPQSGIFLSLAPTTPSCM
jgi:hypothetical protein